MSMIVEKGAVKETDKICISFDFDGTLFEFTPSYPVVLSNVLKELGYEVSSELIREKWSDVPSLYNYRFAHKLHNLGEYPEWEIEEILVTNVGYLLQLVLPEWDDSDQQATRIFHRDVFKRCVDKGYFPVKGIKELLSKLRELGVYTVIVSGNSSFIITEELRRHGLDGLFDDIFTPDLTKTEKCLIFPIMLKSVGFDPEMCLHIGDDPGTDAGCPLVDGMRSAIIRRESGSRFKHVHVGNKNFIKRYLGEFADLQTACEKMLNIYGLSLSELLITE